MKAEGIYYYEMPILIPRQERQLQNRTHQKNTVLYIEDNPITMELVVNILFRDNLRLLQAP
jgi:hypothetical protein